MGTMKMTLVAVMILLLSGCGPSTCHQFAGDPVSFSRCSYAERGCEERWGERIQAFYCLPASDNQSSMTCTCIGQPAPSSSRNLD
jgi:uncharacterized protein YceK